MYSKYYIDNLSIESWSSERDLLCGRMQSAAVVSVATFPHRCRRDFLHFIFYSTNTVIWILQVPTRSVQHVMSPPLCYDALRVFFLPPPLFSIAKPHCASAGGLKMKKGQRQQHNKPGTPKKERWGKKRKRRERGGEFNTQPEGPRGVSNCVIKYVTGSLDVSAEAWSLCYYCAEACGVHAHTRTLTNTSTCV